MELILHTSLRKHVFHWIVMPSLYPILFFTDYLGIRYLGPNLTAWPKILTANFEHDISKHLRPPGQQNPVHGGSGER